MDKTKEKLSKENHANAEKYKMPLATYMEHKAIADKLGYTEEGKGKKTFETYLSDFGVIRHG